MSVIDSTNRSICIYCKSVGDEYHDIFDEVGLELQLPKLIGQFFGLTLKGEDNNGSRQQLCDECVNRLIELVDLEEHNKEIEQANNDDAQSEESQQVPEEAEAVPSEVDIYNEATYVDSLSADGAGSSSSHENITTYVATSEEFYDQTLASESEEHYAEEYEFENNQTNAEDDDVHNDDTLHCMENVTDVTQIVEQQIENDDDLLELECGEANINIMDDVPALEEEAGDLCQEFEQEYITKEETKTTETAYVIVYEEPEAAIQRELDANLVEEFEEHSSMDIIISTDDNADEEYLIEETFCSDDYDNVELNEYLDNAIVTNFEDLQLQWTVECKLCLYKYHSFQELIRHPCVNELVGEQQWCCIIADCDDGVTSLKSIARHLIIKHYSDVESLSIYGRCPECQKPFSNITDFNKHSCCTIKRKAGTRNFCQACSLDFQSMKRYVFHMQFHLTKHRPKVCLLCSLKFNNGEEFFDHVNYFHEPETAMACIKCDRFFQDKSVFDQHMTCHNSRYAFECRYCPKKYTNRSGLTSHMDIYHNHEMKHLQCEYCYKEFVNQASYRSHIKAHMPEASVKAYVCSECGLISNNEDIIKSHIESEESSLDNIPEVVQNIISIAYTCECCSMDFFSASHLQKHRRSPKHDEKLFYCPICRKVFKTLKHMRNHMTSHKDYEEWQNVFPISRFYMCNIDDCMDAYPLWTSLYYHKKRHKNNKGKPEGNLTCQFCEKICGTKMSLAIHVSRVHNNNNIKCQYCQKSYKQEKELKKHIDYMHVSVNCSKCNKVFKNHRNLLSHEQLVHKNKKRYFCSHCEKGYYYKSELQSHEKNVHPDTTYRCEICGFVTTYPKSLEIHKVAKHSDDWPFKCTLCSRGFGRKQLLDMHMKRHKEDKDFICYEYCNEGCNASFINYFLLKKHIETQHPSAKQNEAKPKRRQRRGKQLYVVEDDETGDVELVIDDPVTEDLGSDEYIIEDDVEGEEDEVVDEYEEEDEMDYEDMIA